MRSWMAIIVAVPAMILANQGSSLYGPSSQHGAVADCSHLNQEESAFAAKLSTIHKNVFCQQFSPTQRKNAMELTKMKDPLNTSPGDITPDHAVEIIMQSARDSNTTPQSQNQQQQMPSQYQPKNQSPYSQQPGGCRKY